MELICKGGSAARKRYQRASFQFLLAYLVVLVCSVWFLKHDGHERFYLYFWSVIPALPIVGIVYRMGRYLREETDEYQRWMVMQGLLVGTAAMLVVLVVSDFLRSFAGAGDLPPFVLFSVFAWGAAITQIAQKLRNRAPKDEASE
jgi:hypothetical protein